MIGETLGHYRVLDLLGVGGMGEVYRAEDTTLDREVALKVLPAELSSDPERLARFEREAKTLAALDHPNIVTVFTVEHDKGVHFLTMQLVEGKPLSELIPKGGMPLDWIFDIAIPLADALATAHGRGVIHRDLKPANIMVTDEGRVKVLDFGLAKLRQEAQAPVATQLPTEPLTEEGRILGTMPYMSPEQLEGRDLDGRTDVFSLGAMLYQMATGERPFRGETSASLISSIIKDTPREVDAIRAELPHHLSRVISHCLEKNPEDRYQSVKDVRNELKSLKRETASREVAAREVMVRRNEPTWRPRWPVLIVGCLALVALALWLVLGGRQPEVENADEPRAETARSSTVASPRSDREMIVILPFENLGDPEDGYFTAGITEEITSRFAAVRDLGVISRNSAVRYAETDKSIREIGTELGVDYVLEGTVRWAKTGDSSRVRITPQLIRVRDDTQLWADTYDREIDDIFAVQAEIALQVVKELGVSLLGSEQEALDQRPTDNMQAYQLYLRALAVEGEWFDESVIRSRQVYLEQAVELDPAFAEAWVQLAFAQNYLYGYRYDQSEEQRQRAWQTAQRAIEVGSNSPPLRHKVLGSYYFQVPRDYTRALEEAARVERLSPNDSTAYSSQAYILRRQGLWEEAARKLGMARRLDPRRQNVAVQLGQINAYLGRYEDALSNGQAAMEIDPSTAMPHFGQAYVYWAWRGDTSAARRALDLIPDGVPLSSSMLDKLFWQLIYEDQPAAALDYLESLDVEAVGLSINYRPISLLAGVAHNLMGDTQSARSSFEVAAVHLENELDRRPDYEKAHSSLGVAYAALGQKEEGIRHGERASELVPLSREPYFGQSEVEDLAWILTLVGDYDAAIDELGRLLSVPSRTTLPFLEMDPRWAPLLDRPRFKELEEKYG